MEIKTYHDLSVFEETHWWYMGRRRIIESFIQEYCPLSEQALDVGAGTGYNTFLLERYAKRVYALEPAKAAVSLFKNKKVTVFQGDLTSFVTEERFDIVTLFDVLEHIENDTATLGSIQRLLTRGGKVLLTVPALPFLWSGHDEVHHHFRRYTKRTLQRVAEEAGLRVVRMTYFNFFLFPVITGFRIVGRMFPKKNVSDFRIVPKCLNTFLAWLFGSERYLLQVMNIPIGVSLICVLEKTE